MNEAIKKILYNTVGTAVLSTEKIKELLEELIQNRVYTEEEGRRVILQVIHNAEDIANSAQQKINSTLNNILSTFNLPGSSEILMNFEDFIKQIRAQGVFKNLKNTETSITRDF